MAYNAFRNPAIVLAAAVSALAASVAVSGLRGAPACTEQVDSAARPGFIAFAGGTAPTCIRIRLR